MIINAISRAYQIMHERNWDTIYWAIDLHGVCLKSNYEQGGYQWINDDTLKALKMIAARPENKIILWSSVYNTEKFAIEKFFSDQGITNIVGFNSNPLEANNRVSSFDEKFYFSVLLDDKAGFDPQVHWDEIITFYNAKRAWERADSAQSVLDL